MNIRLGVLHVVHCGGAVLVPLPCDEVPETFGEGEASSGAEKFSLEVLCNCPHVCAEVDGCLCMRETGVL